MVVPAPIRKIEAPAEYPMGEAAQLTAFRNVDEADDREATSGSNPLEYLMRTLRGRWAKVLIASALLGAAGAVIGFFIQKPKFVSTGIVQVSANRPGIMYEDRDDSRLRLFDAFVSAEAAYLGSRPVLERALSEDGIADVGWAPSAENFRRLREALEVNFKGGLITVTCNSVLAEESAAMVNSLLDAYSDMHVEHLRREDSVRERQLVIREAELLEKLESLEGRIKAVGQEYGVQSIAAAHVRKIAQIEEVDVRVTELATTVASREAADSLSEVDTGDVEIKRLVVLDHALADMLFERTKRAAHLASLPTDLAESHPAVKQAKKALASIDAAVEDRRAQLATLGSTGALTKAGKNSSEESLEGLRALWSRLKDRVEDLRGEAIELNARLIELEFLDGEREQVRELLDQTRAVLEQVRVESQNTLPGTIEIRARGSVPAQPAEDKRMIMAAAGGFGGVGVGLFSVLGLGLLLRRLRYSDELDAATPDIALSGVLPDTELDGVNASDYTHAIHRLRNEIQLSRSGNQKSQLIVVTGSRTGCGISQTAKALAESHAQTQVKTVVVDADLLTQSLTEEMNLSGKEGVREALRQDRLNGEVCSVSKEHLFAVPAGQDEAVSDHHVSRHAMARLFSRLRNEFDTVIVDVGTFQEHLVARLSAAQADQTVFVVAKDQSPQETSTTLEALKEVTGSLHLVFNFAAVDDPNLLHKVKSTNGWNKILSRF